jgi:transcriptional regulator with XRE-family HTH domain
MDFGQKIKDKRRELKISQQALAEATGLSLRSIQNYESGQRQPANISIVKRIAQTLNVTSEYLLDDRARYVIDAAEKGGENAAADIDRLLSDIQGLFAGGSLSQSDKDKVMRAVNEIYWETKDAN